MIKALLIGFKYKREYQELHGIIIDLYHAYTRMKKLGADVKIITDMIDDEQIKLIKDAIYSGDVHSDIVSFITSIQETEEHLAYTNSSDLVADTAEFVYNAGQIFFYYTGHGENGYFLLPQGDRILMKDYIRVLIDNSYSGADIVSINDCCNADNMGIPFTYVSGCYRPINDTKLFTDRNIIHMVSTMSNETSIMKERGSIFTKHLFSRLNNCSVNDKNRELSVILEEIKVRCRKIHTQTACLYVSRPNITLWPRWMFQNDENNVQVNYLPQAGCFTIQKKSYDLDETHKPRTPFCCEMTG